MPPTLKKRRRRAIVTNTQGPYGFSQRKTLKQLAKDHSQMLSERRKVLQALPSDTRAAVNDMVRANGGTPDDVEPRWEYDASASAMDWADDDDVGISAVGGDHEDVVFAAHQHIVIPNVIVPPASQERRARLRALYANWSDQIPALSHAYLCWKHKIPEVEPAQDTARDSPNPSQPEELGEFSVLEISTYESTATTIPRRGGEWANVSLIRHGLLGTAPVYPTIAISLHTLELYHRLRRRHPRLSIQAFCRALCDLHDVNYRTAFREQFSTAFDAYLDIIRTVEHQVNVALGRDAADWRIKNSCVCCNYTLENEPVLTPAKLMAMDGNNSAKRIRNAGHEDERVFASDYFLTREQVNKFKDEVKNRPPQRTDRGQDGEESEEDAPWLPDGSPSDSPPDEDRDHSKCTERWKASAAEHHKRALDIYDATGMFASACRHGFILVACEMVQSGELAKYPLAVCDHVIDRSGDDLGMGLDNGCKLKSTVKSSALLGPKAQQHHFRLSVNSFHGYAHSRTCQLDNHPLYLQGWGIEDLEGMERVFSASNAVASTIRYATRYHWHQALDLHFKQWDEDKYSELSKFILNNYQQCLDILAENIPELEKMKSASNLTDEDFEHWIAEERAFLHSLKDEPEERVLEVAYIQALEAREKADAKWNAVSKLFLKDSGNASYSQSASATRRLEGRRRAAMDELTVAIRAVGDLEEKLAIDPPWTPAHPRYQKALQWSRRREFHRALDRVEQLVVQRLFELSKANIAGMGYKMRTSIWKALKKRGAAIRNALKRYNELARDLSPPAPFLEWKDVVNFTFVSEFDILRHTYSRSDITSRPWTLQSNRELTARYFKILRAREEIIRLNVEASRLHTSLEDEQELYQGAARQVAEGSMDEAGDPVLAAEIHAIWRTRDRVNRTHRQRLQQLWSLPGFSGARERGARLGAQRDRAESALSDMGSAETATITADDLHDRLPSDTGDNSSAQLDDHVQEQLVSLGGFMEDLAAAPGNEDEDDVPRTRQGIPVSMVSSFRF